MHQSDCFREFLEEFLFVELVVCVCTILGHCLKSLLACFIDIGLAAISDSCATASCRLVEIASGGQLEKTSPDMCLHTVYDLWCCALCSRVKPQQLFFYEQLVGGFIYHCLWLNFAIIMPVLFRRCEDVNGSASLRCRCPMLRAFCVAALQVSVKKTIYFLCFSEI